MDNGINRRAFLKTGAAAVGAAVAGAVTNARATEESRPASAVVGPGRVTCKLTMNGKEVQLAIEPRVTLLRALRNESDHTGAKEICDRGPCGGCTVLVDDKPVVSCMMLALDAQGKSIVTVEGLSKGGRLHPVQESFRECDALQCGYCTPGFVISAVALLRKNPSPTPDDIKRGLDGNLCRCAAYNHIFEAVQRAAKKMREAAP